jgi:hypothetical protein
VIGTPGIQVKHDRSSEVHGEIDLAASGHLREGEAA